MALCLHLAISSFLLFSKIFYPNEIILACRKTVLKNNDSTWVKNGLENFDVPMGGYDSSQIADLVGFNFFRVFENLKNA